MKQIVRQKDLQLRGAVHDIIDNRIDAALQRIETQTADRVARSASAALPESAIQETEAPVNDIVEDWTDRTPEARSRTLIIAQLNADRKAINAGIHAVLAARGELGEKAIKVPVLDKITHKARLQGYMDAFLKCADSGQMCGIHAMLSDSALFEEPLQKATSRLAQTDLRILTSVLVSGRESGELAFTAEPADVAIIIGSAIKGALMLNRIPPHDACSRTMSALIQLLSRP